MSSVLTWLQFRSRSKRVIAWLSVVVASGLLTGRSQAEEPEPRTWTLSDAHRDSIAGLTFSPDNKTLASAGRDGTIKLWDLATGRVRFTLDAHLSRLSTAVAFSPDGKTLATGSGMDPKSSVAPRSPIKTGGITLWDVSTGRRRATLDVPLSHVRCLAYSPDAGTLAWTASDGVARLWDLPRNRLRSEIKVSSHTLAIAPDLKTVAFAVAGRDHTVVLVDVVTGQERAALEGHRNRIWSLAFSPDGKTLASGAGEPSMSSGPPRPRFPSEVKLWDLTGAQPKERASLTGLTLEIHAVAFSPDSRSVAAGGFGNQVRVWDARSGALVADLESSCNHVSTIAFSPDGQSLAAGGLHTSISIWDTATWGDRSELGGRSAYCLAYTPDGNTLAAGLSDGTVALWDVAKGRVRLTLQGHTQRVTALSVSLDGQRLAAGSDDGVIAIWDPATGVRQGRNSFGHTGAVTSLAFSPDGKTLASGGMDATVRVGGVTWPSVQAVLRRHQRGVSSVAFSPDGKTLVSADHDGTLRSWDVASQRERSVVQVHTFKLNKSREETKVIDGETVTMRVAIPGETEDHGVPIYCLAFSPDGKTLATGDRAMYETGGVSLRDAGTGQERVNFKQFAGTASRLNDVNALAYSPDGKLLASAGYSTIRLSDAATGKEIVVLNTGIPYPLRDLAFSPDNKTLAWCNQYVVQLWDVKAALRQGVEK